MNAAPYRIAWADDPTSLPAIEWDRLVADDPHGNVFLSHAYLCALHESASAVPRTGWGPQWLTLWAHEGAGERLAAAVPLYLKGHSYGEYVFDWSWAEALERLGMAYYPKLLVAVPFTPVEGSRILAADEHARDAAAGALLDFARRQGLSSLHVIFAPREQVERLGRKGMLLREGLQFHWSNRGYADFDAFLAALAQPKRKKIRAERRKVAEAGVTLDRRVGPQITRTDWNFFLRCYENTYAEHGSSPYLNLDFFLRLARTMPQCMMLVRAHRGGRAIASALGIFDRERSALYGRYWGAIETVSCLHFECCYYQMIEFAIEQGLRDFEGGAQGAHKLARGLDPVPTYSAHWIREPALREAVERFLERERGAVRETIEEFHEHRAVKTALTPGPSRAGAGEGSS
jgi:predicted N-acyltransferase